MDYVPGIIFLGKGVERLKRFVTTYLVLVSAILTNIILNHTYGFYHDKHVELTLSDVIDFFLSPQGALFITTLALIVGAQYVLVPLLIKAMLHFLRGVFLFGGNFFFYSVYFTLTKILRVKSEKKFSFISENELLNYTLYLLRVCHYYKGRIVRNKSFEFYKWYVTYIADRASAVVSYVCLITAILVSTWALIHHYNFLERAPFIYYIVVVLALFYIGNSIIVSWIVRKSDYFLDIVKNSISYSDSLNLT